MQLPDHLLDNNPIRVYDVYEIYNSWMNSKELIKALEKDGWVLRGSKGSHHVFNHPPKVWAHYRSSSQKRSGHWIGYQATETSWN